MKVRRFSTLAVAAAIVALGLATLASAQPKNFRAHLAGRNEVPPVETLAQGQALFQLDASGDSLSYILNVAKISDVSAAHVHLAVEGANGPVVALLYGGPPISGQTQGQLAAGVITSADLVGPMAGMTLASLIEAIELGETYVNVHTSAYPGGEIRGQIE